jgi:hypothetical protein
MTFDKQVTWISGMPRSGTTWLSQIFASSPDVRLKFCPLFSYEFKNKLDQNSNKADWLKLFKDVYNTESEYLDQDYLRKDGLVPSFINKKQAPEHLVIKSTFCIQPMRIHSPRAKSGPARRQTESRPAGESIWHRN